jgi:eukaryotic-like serine/threonine-protein kinase
MPIPLRLGSYSIVKQIGVGASSNVYLAIEDKTFASVAIKQLRSERLSAPYRSLLINEVAIAASFEQKNIVRQIGADLQALSGPYLVLEYLSGESLDHHQNTDSLLPINTVLAVIEQVADALQYVAQQGVVHRDVKPENIIRLPNGLVKLMDFGCAIKSGAASKMVAGSLAYMSPEQLDGVPLDERADIYSLGATLYRLLTGKNTFTADNPFDARIAVLNFPATPIQKYRPELPANLTMVVHKSLQKNTSARYANWAEFIAAFGNAAHEVRMSVQDFDVYRGFTTHTQSAIYDQLSASRQFSRSGFSRSAMLGE